MNIHQFYEADPRRRSSDEEEFGDGWTELADVHATYRVHRVNDTGEVYAVREPHPGGILARYLDQLDLAQATIDELTVEVYGTYARDDLAAALAGWPAAMNGPNSLDWVRARLR
jgi:hypothetical protein